MSEDRGITRLSIGFNKTAAVIEVTLLKSPHFTVVGLFTSVNTRLHFTSQKLCIMIHNTFMHVNELLLLIQ